MADTEQNNRNTAISTIIKSMASLRDKLKSGFLLLVKKIQNMTLPEGRKELKSYWRKLRKVKFRQLSIYKKTRKIFKKISDSWRIILICLPTFLFCYYFIGGIIADNTDVTTECTLRKEHLPLFETPECMAFLIKREVDAKMWTPNLPPIFPAYALDNMPNFQIGIRDAIKDVASVIRNFSQNNQPQQKLINKAYKLLSYSPKNLADA